MTILQYKKHFAAELSGIYNDSELAFLSSVFFENILQLNNFDQRRQENGEISNQDGEKFLDIITELKTGKPYQHILGETEFYGMHFFVNENVLVPRPETEELLEIAISRLNTLQISSQSFTILDIGTGSGVIPLVLKKHFPRADVSSIDLSEKALEVAKKNADLHQLKINFIQDDYLDYNVNEKYNVIISNPPYIGIDEEKEIEPSVKDFEPKMALFSPTDDALLFYKKIAVDSRDYLKEKGLLFLEINQKLGYETLELYKTIFTEVELLQDLSGNDRFIVGIK